ncbi:winged helix-turn-helix transcriptional regulator [Nocardia sp. CA-135398]|uniref:winged helix-turn-helix transcriptional regulator n=1 Tax=Nocardia sp. CA-135398 TaxID=3239977 RepID=UPI003D956513
MPDRTDDLDSLRVLVSHRLVVEVLDAVAARARAVSELTTAVAGARRALESALRVIASDGLIVADPKGSWDRPPADTAVIRLTGRGQAVVAALSSLAVWTALYEKSGPVRHR